jgi:hypothetical protein
MDDTHSIKAMIRLADVRRIITVMFILQRGDSAQQTSIVEGSQTCSSVGTRKLGFYLFLLFSAQTYS